MRQPVQLGPCGHALANVIGTHRPSLNGHELQLRSANGVSTPSRPSDQEVQPQTKARFQHAPVALPLPKQRGRRGRPQATALQKHLTRLQQATVTTAANAAVNVVKQGAAWRAIGLPLDGVSHKISNEINMLVE
jgi:hypothetical protein